MTVLVFDLGNSRWKWALAGDGLRAPGRAQDYGDDFARSLDAALATVPRPDRAAAVAVASGARRAALHAWLAQRWNLALDLFSPEARGHGVINSYREPARLGADRWAALVAARARTRGPVCVVDAGTAVTIDVLDADGVFRGGVILPGLALQRTALLQGTTGIAESVGEEHDPLARSTADAVATGTLFGLAGAIDRVLDEQVLSLGTPPTVFVSGGDAPRLLPLLRHAAIAAPDLVLEGVARMVES